MNSLSILLILIEYILSATKQINTLIGRLFFLEGYIVQKSQVGINTMKKYSYKLKYKHYG